MASLSMASLITPPPSSSPSQVPDTQPTTGKGSKRQLEDECRGPVAPLPKQRRKGPSAIGELNVISLLSDEETRDIGNGQDRQPENPGIPPSRRKSSLTSLSLSRLQSRSRGIGSAKALSNAAIGRPNADAKPWQAPPAPNQITPSAQWPQQQHWQPPAPAPAPAPAQAPAPAPAQVPAPTPAPNPYYNQHGWAQPPPMSQAGPESQHHGTDMPSTMPHHSYLPAWNYTFSNNGSGSAHNFNIPYLPHPPNHQDQVFVPSQQQSWPHQQWHEYDMPIFSNTYVGYSPQPSQMPRTPPPGTASCPIVLDGPMHSVPTPVYAPSTLPASQIPGYGPAGNQLPLKDWRQSTTYGNSAAWPSPVSQLATVVQHAIVTQSNQKAGKRPATMQTAKTKPESSTYEPQLCPEQEDLVRLIESGKNVFYTGSAGCGKSTVLKAFVKRLKDKGKRVRIVAPTGRAALNVGGVTTWTFAGWTPDSHKLPIEKIEQRAHGNHVYDRLTKTDVLVIDEISMVENLHFERLNILMKAARYDPKLQVQPAFGGCQIVVTGDFCQLPPVKPFRHCIQCGREMSLGTGSSGKLVHTCRQHGEYADEDKWAFRSKAWQQCAFEHVHLKTIHRQNDQTFISMLQKCRLGYRLTESEIDLLMNHSCRTAQATKLFSTRREASEVNRDKFEKLKGTNHPYWCHDSYFHSERHPQHQWKNRPGEWGNESGTTRPPTTKKPLHALEDHRWGKCVQLKQGMLVVLLTNLDLEAGLCNGSQGLIKGFEEYDPKMLPIRETYDARGRKKIEAKPGQKVIRGENAGVQEGEVKNFITSESAPIRKWPVVRFHNGEVRTVYAECSIAQLGDEEPYCLLARTQIPLAPAWAMTIHKSQSLTLDRVIVNLSKAFEEGQVYVALSRATGLEGLKIEGDGEFLRSKLMVNTEVAAFLKEKFGDIYGVNATEEVEPSAVNNTEGVGLSTE